MTEIISKESEIRVKIATNRMWEENWKTYGWIREDKRLGEIILVQWMKEKLETALEKKGQFAW